LKYDFTVNNNSHAVMFKHVFGTSLVALQLLWS